MQFKGDILITDPCYIFNQTDWDRYCHDFDHSFIRELGFTNYIWEDTIFGDGSWRVLNSDNNMKIGSIGADAGLMGVFLLNEVKKYCPKNNIDELARLGAIIKDFDGNIEYNTRDAGFTITGKGNINFHTDDY